MVSVGDLVKSASRWFFINLFHGVFSLPKMMFLISSLDKIDSLWLLSHDFRVSL
ncbi:unnamed protein product [Arabidopsis halleri]